MSTDRSSFRYTSGGSMATRNAAFIAVVPNRRQAGHGLYSS